MTSPILVVLMVSVSSSAPVLRALPVTGSSAIPIATINAAVVAVFIGALIAYAVVVLQRMHEMGDEILAGARRVNEIWSITRWIDSRRQTMEVFARYDPISRDSRQEMGLVLWHALSRIPADAWNRESGPGFTEADLMPVDEAASICLAAMYLLTAGCPFASQVRNVDGVVEHVEPIRLDPASVAETEPWADDAAAFSGWAIRTFEDQRGELHALLESMTDDWGSTQLARAIATADPNRRRDLEARFSLHNPAAMTDQFFDRFHRLNEVALDTKRKIDMYNRYRDARLSPSNLRRLSLAGVAAFAVLVAGVLVPMVHESAPRWLYAWFPAVAYALAASGGLGLVNRQRVIRKSEHQSTETP